MFYLLNIGIKSQVSGVLNKMLNKLEKILGENHPDYARTLFKFGRAYYFVGQNYKALEYFQKCQKIQRQILGQNHPQYAQTISMIANIFQRTGQYQKSLHCFKKCEKINQIFEQNQQFNQSTRYNLCSIYLVMGQIEKANEIASKISDESKLYRKMPRKQIEYIQQIKSNLFVQISQASQLSSQQIQSYDSTCNLKKKIQQMEKGIKLINKYSKRQMMGLKSRIQKHIKSFLMKKQYENAGGIWNFYLMYRKNITNPYRGILIQTLELWLKITVSQAFKHIYQLYEFAHQLENDGFYTEACDIYSRFILQKYPCLWLIIPQAMAYIESDLQHLQQKMRQERLPEELILNKIQYKNELKQEIQQQSQKYLQKQRQNVVNCKQLVKMMETFYSDYNSSNFYNFQFSLFNEVVSYIEAQDKQSAFTEIQIIRAEINEKFKQNGQISDILNDLTNFLFSMATMNKFLCGNLDQQYKQTERMLIQKMFKIYKVEQ